jgi:putative secretion ATPase (PEP-CTERM system associated)
MVEFYKSFYNLERDPFRLNADHTFAYAHKSYKTALSYLQYAAYREEGFVMITGKPGTGKTTLISEILSELNPQKVITATLVTTQLDSHDLLHMVAAAFGLEHTHATKSTLLLRIEGFLRKNRQAGRRAILIVDEAQGLTLDAIEELRQLSNMVVDGTPMQQTFLIGQDELRGLVKSPQLDQLRQRIVASSHLEPLTEEEVFSYVRHRLLTAGWNDDPQIANAVVKLVHHYSNGIPRKINLIFGRLLLYGFIEDRHSLLREDMEAVIQELKQELLIFDTDITASDVYGPEACTGFLEPCVSDNLDEKSETDVQKEPEESIDSTAIGQEIQHLEDGLLAVKDISAVSVPELEAGDADQEPELEPEDTKPAADAEKRSVAMVRKLVYLWAVLLLFVLVSFAGIKLQHYEKYALFPSLPEVFWLPSSPATDKPARQPETLMPKSELIRRETGSGPSG